MKNTYSKSLVTAALVGVVTFQCATGASLLHRYSFNSDNDASDSVGAADGTLLANGTISGGVLNTTGTAGGTSGVSLPASSIAGITSDFTIETFAIYNGGTGQQFSTLFAFGTGGAPGARNTYLLSSPRRGGTGNPSGIGINPVGGATGDFADETVLTGPTFVGGQLTQFVFTYESATKIGRLFVNGALASTSPALTDPFSLEAVGSTFRGINGNNPIDPSMNGSTDDFRIYDGTLTEAQVLALNTLGANATNDAINTIVIPEPASFALLTLGAAAFAGRRRRS